MNCEAKQASPEELAESRRRCWHTGCKRKARLEWCGWRWCVPHYWLHKVRYQSSWGHLWVVLRYTEIARHGPK